MIDFRFNRPFFAKTAHFHPAWWLGPIGLAGCAVIGLVLGYFQSLVPAIALLGAALALLWIATVLLRPRWAVYFYTFAAVNLNGIDLPLPVGDLRLSPDIILTSLLIVGVLLRLLNTRARLTNLPISGPYLLFLAVPFITLLWSPVPFQSLKGTFRFVGYYALIWLVVEAIHDRKHVLRMVTALLLSPLFPVLLGFYQAATGRGQNIWAGELFNRIYALAGGPFTLAFYLVLIIPWLLILFLGKPPGASENDGGAGHWPLNRFWLAFLLINCLGAILLTFIRGSWIALAAALLLLGLMRYRKLLITLPIAMAGLLWAYAPAQSRLAQTLDPDSTLFGRLAMWKFAWEWIRGSPLVGVGMKAFEFYYILLSGPVSSPGLMRRERFLVGNRPHNEIIGFLLDVGLIGTAALLLVLIILLRIGLRLYRQGPDELMRLLGLSFVISTAGMAVGAMGDNVFSQPTVAVYFWLMAGLVLAIDRHLLPKPSSQSAMAEITAGKARLKLNHAAPFHGR